MSPAVDNYVNVQMFGESEAVETMLAMMDSRLSPEAIAGFLGANIDPYLRRRAGERFANEGDDVVGTWLPLSSGTVAIREGLGFSGAHPINKRTGELEDYITGGGANPGIPVAGLGATLKFPGRTATGELKSKVETAQRGKPATGGMRATPPRPVLGMNARDLSFTVMSLTFFLSTGRGKSK